MRFANLWMQYATSARGLDEDVAKKIAARVQHPKLLRTSRISVTLCTSSFLNHTENLEYTVIRQDVTISDNC